MAVIHIVSILRCVLYGYHPFLSRYYTALSPLCGSSAASMRWSAARHQEPVMPVGTTSSGSRLAAGALARRGVALGGRRSPGGAFPMVLWQNSV
jgi:hypothetical protein